MREPGITVDLARSLSLTTVRRGRARRQRLGKYKLQEIENQMQVPFSGATSMTGLTVAQVDVAFDVQFITGTPQRFSNVPYPHFSYGVYLENKAPDPPDEDFHPGIPAVICAINEWDRDPLDCFVGCSLWVHVLSPPEYEYPRNYNGHLLLSFQGFGALTDAEGGAGG